MEQAEFRIPCGKAFQTLSVSKERIAACLLPKEPSHGKMTEDEIVHQALANPIASLLLSELARNARRILVITPDHTRPMPSRITMPILLTELRKGNPDAQIVLLVATGLHRKTTEAELRQRYGEEIVNREKIVVHNANDASQLVSFGSLSSGGELWLNNLVANSDLVIAEGFIEPHFFAGYSGGRKSILPGVAGAETIR